MTGNASCAQYGCSPTPTMTVGTPTPGPGQLPHTGYAVAWVLLAGLLLIAIGMAIGPWIRGRYR